MPLKVLRIVKDLKFLISDRLQSKKEILDVVENDAQKHRIINRRQEEEDKARVSHAHKEFNEESRIMTDAYLFPSVERWVVIVINFIFVLMIGTIIYFIFFK